MVNCLNSPERDGGFWLPNIQRHFVWTEDQIERLFDSIMREYPISTLLIWRTKSPIKRRKFIDIYKRNLKLDAFRVPEDNSTKLLVLDGQQRLQSLFIGLKGSYDKKELFFHVLSGDPVSPEDIRYRFKFLESQKAIFPWIKFKDIVFGNGLANRIARSIKDKAPYSLSDKEIDRIEDNVALSINQFNTVDFLAYQELDSVDNSKVYQEEDVVEIFIRANDGGTKLSKSDLLFSLLIASWEDAEENLEELLDKLNHFGYGFTRDFVLKTCLSLLGKGAQYEVSKFRDTSTREEIFAEWKEISKAIRDVRDFLYQKTFLRTDRALPSYLSLIPVIYFRYLFPDQWKSANGIEEYMLRVLITGAFSGNPDTLIDKCTRHIRDTKEFDLKQIFGIIRADGRTLEITKDTILNQYYGSKNIHLIFNIWYKDFNYNPSYENNLPQVDHIFPQSLLKSIRDINPETNKRNILRYRSWERDQIANCMLLTAEENGGSGKRDTSPEVWFQDKSDSYLEMHLIPKEKELWKLDNFRDFIEARKLLVSEKFENMIQPEV